MIFLFQEKHYMSDYFKLFEKVSSWDYWSIEHPLMFVSLDLDPVDDQKIAWESFINFVGASPMGFSKYD